MRVVAAVVLGDMAWGLLRRSGSSGAIIAHAGQMQRVNLPYSQEDAPLSRSFRALTLNGMTWQGVLAGLGFALGGGLLIGIPAVVLSVLAGLLTVMAWASTRRGGTSAAYAALLDVLLPWLLGMAAVGWAHTDFPRWQPFVVALGFTVLQWGMLCAVAYPTRGQTAALRTGVLAVFCELVALRMPWAAAVVAVLLAPLVYWFGDVEREDNLLPLRLTRAGPWVLVALFVSALALR